jgi:hypothetical protein
MVLQFSGRAFMKKKRAFSRAFVARHVGGCDIRGRRVFAVGHWKMMKSSCDGGTAVE